MFFTLTLYLKHFILENNEMIQLRLILKTSCLRDTLQIWLGLPKGILNNDD